MRGVYYLEKEYKLVERILERLASLEFRRIGSLNFHSFLGLRVAAHTSCSLANFKCTKSNELNLAAILKFINYGLGKSLKSCCCVLLAKACFLGHFCY